MSVCVSVCVCVSQFQFEVGLLVAVVMSGLVCLSRLYTGMHSALVSPLSLSPLLSIDHWMKHSSPWRIYYSCYVWLAGWKSKAGQPTTYFDIHSVEG